MPNLTRTSLLAAAATVAVATTLLFTSPAGAQEGKGKGKGKQKEAPGGGLGYSDTPVIPGQKWKVHDISRPRPGMVDPGTPSTWDRPGKPPSDAIVLFDGKDLSQWTAGAGRDGQVRPASWKVENGYMECCPERGGGGLTSKEKFGDAQYHIEWAAPPVVRGVSQNRGNSGILIMGRYEVQVLDSWDNPTYADGQAASIYGWWPPMVNASRKPGEWQFYEILFTAPRFERGMMAKPARVTVLHNGVLVHHDQEIGGPMAHRVVRRYEAHEPEEPLSLQNHNEPVRIRMIWVRRLKGYDKP